ncbi:FlgN protein [Cohaesibacter sp. ES.047]|uniref:flagellar export chaperone FlgN n=1 Tax=Cohaesibacter sp. ES.047 TaxID=1798205 RepID=UPI000BB7035D|nr:flagellar export chaperone FlgN [Cohaesibacter sp. ES.047]SNY91750.1 FlgN protein [Cohaesibacter sp. ES.047]
MSDVIPATPPLTAKEVAEIETAMDEAIKVADEIIELAAEENRRLESGRPVSLEGLLVRKQKLVSEFSAFFKTYKSERAAMMLTSDSKFSLLQERVQTLATSMMENAENLNRAVNANERRTSAIMRAIRDSQKEVAGATNYGADGYQTGITAQTSSLKQSREI